MEWMRSACASKNRIKLFDPVGDEVHYDSISSTGIDGFLRDPATPVPSNNSEGNVP
jgi:hypothetical protein